MAIRSIIGCTRNVICPVYSEENIRSLINIVEIYFNRFVDVKSSTSIDFHFFSFVFLSVIVVFDGARLDERKLSTTLERAKKRVDYSTKISVNVDLSPLLLRQTFLDVLDELNIPYISALGEGDEECVSLANDLNCYLIARDSDYYCYHLHQGYIPFDYVDVNPIQKDSYSYLPAQLFTLDTLLDRFPGLNPSTLALACSLCGNDYVRGNLLELIFNHVTATVDKSEKNPTKKTLRTKHWYLLQWSRRFDHLDQALEHLTDLLSRQAEKKSFLLKLQASIQSYLQPSNTLIYRFALTEKNRNLQKNEHFRQLAEIYFQTHGLVMFNDLK